MKRAYSKLIQLLSLPPSLWLGFIKDLRQRKVSGLVTCVLPGTRRAIRVPTAEFEESYRYFSESPGGRLELGFFMEKLRAGDVLFDIGAFRGVYGTGAKAALGDAVEVHFFEPLATNLERLRAVIAANVFEKTTVVPKAVGSGQAVTGTIGEDMMLRTSATKDAPAFESTSLDAYVQSAGVTPTILKMDVEGFERDVVAGAQRLLYETKPRIWLELHPGRLQAMGTSWEDLVESLRSYGYRVTMFSDFDLPTRESSFHVWCEPVKRVAP